MNDEKKSLEILKKEFEIRFKDLRCYLDPEKPHFLVEAKILPCSNLACLVCIQNSIQNSTLKCNLCNSEHKSIDINKLESKETIFEKLNVKNDKESDDIELKLNEFINSMIDEFTNRDQVIENLCLKAKKEVSERIKACKEQLDVLHQQLLIQLDLIKQNVSIEINSLNTTIEQKSQEYENYVKKIEDMLENFDQNREVLEKEIYNCQNYIDELTSLDENFHKILRKIAFESSEWIPDESFVYPQIEKFNLNN